MISKTVGRARAMWSTTMFRLLDLPNEVIAAIVEQIDNRITLQRLAYTCHRIKKLTEPVLYRHVLVRRGSRAEGLLDALSAHTARWSAVHVLDFPCDAVHGHSFNAVKELVRNSPNLKKLMIESPACNSGDFEDEEAWAWMTDRLFEPFQDAFKLSKDTEILNAPLQKLQNCGLFLISRICFPSRRLGLTTGIESRPSLTVIVVSPPFDMR